MKAAPNQTAFETAPDKANYKPQPSKNVPAAGSIKRQILETLRAGEHLTSLEAWMWFGTSRLASLIHQLRCEGWQIDSEIIEVETANGRRAHVAQYRIGEE
jgi:hypothetical protein